MEGKWDLIERYSAYHIIHKKKPFFFITQRLLQHNYTQLQAYLNIAQRENDHFELCYAKIRPKKQKKTEKLFFYFFFGKKLIKKL